MPKYFYPLAATFFSFMAAIGQRSIDSMVQTERNFANTSLVAGTKGAFIKFIDTAGIVFDKGKPVNGLELFTKSERRPGILTWEPEYAEIAATHDFGYTTGPWQFHSNDLKDNPIARGHFVTVWHLTNNNEWKFLVDLGISYSMKTEALPVKKVQTGKYKFKDDNAGSLKQAEETFIRAFEIQGKKAYNLFLSLQSRLNYSGFLPATDAKEREVLLDSLPQKIDYTILGYGVSPMKDLGYIYGYASINNKEDGYLRIWRKEKREWKIALEVLHFR